MRILVVDDAAITRSIVRMILEKVGHEVFDAPSIETAVALFCKVHPDFVFTDFNLAGESGLSLFNQLGEMFPDVPFVLMTASINDEDLVKARAAGIRETILKPLTPEMILKTVEKHKPIDADKRLIRISLYVESKTLQKAREQAKKEKRTPEDVLQDMLNEDYA